MKVLENNYGEVKWQWVKKDFKNAVASIRLQENGYILLEDVGGEKTLAFRRPLYENERALPLGCSPVIDGSDLKRCDYSLEKVQHEEAEAPKPETLKKLRDYLGGLGFKLREK